MSCKLSKETIQLAEEMSETLFCEINAYYSTQLNHLNCVKRIAELIRFIGITEVYINFKTKKLFSFLNRFK